LLFPLAGFAAGATMIAPRIGVKHLYAAGFPGRAWWFSRRLLTFFLISASFPDVGAG